MSDNLATNGCQCVFVPGPAVANDESTLRLDVHFCLFTGSVQAQALQLPLSGTARPSVKAQAVQLPLSGTARPSVKARALQLPASQAVTGHSAQVKVGAAAGVQEVS